MKHLLPEQVLEIQKLLEETIHTAAQIARRYNVSPQAISRIARGDSWTKVTGGPISRPPGYSPYTMSRTQEEVEGAKEAIRLLKETTLSARQIADKSGLSVSAVIAIARGERFRDLSHGRIIRPPSKTKSGRRRLTAANVRTIRQLLEEGLSLNAIANRYDISRSAIRNIREGITYQWVDPEIEEDKQAIMLAKIRAL